jgi:hypothetical protein
MTRAPTPSDFSGPLTEEAVAHTRPLHLFDQVGETGFHARRHCHFIEVALLRL